MNKDTLRRLVRFIADKLSELRLAPPPADETEYDQVIAKAIRSVPALREQVERNQTRVEERYIDLVDQPEGRQSTILTNSPPPMLLALAHGLMRESFAHRFDDVRRSLALAKLAHRAATALAGTDHLSQGSASDLVGESLGYLGNALRLNSDLVGAERAFAEAEAHLYAGTRDQDLRANHLSFLSTLRHTQGRVSEAAALLEREIVLRRSLRDPKKLAEALLNRARQACLVGDDLQLASDLVSQALDMLDEDDHLPMFLGLLHLAEALARNGDGVAAWKLLCTSDLVSLLAGLGEGLRRRHRWVKGITHRALGETAFAARLLTGVRDGFVEAGQPLLAAFASLDLLAVLAAQEKHSEVASLADTVYRTFVAERLEREALAAFLVLHRAALVEELTEELAVKVANFIQRRQHDKEARFE